MFQKYSNKNLLIMESDTTIQKAIIKDPRKHLSRINVIRETKINGDCVSTLWQKKKNKTKIILQQSLNR